MQRMLYRYRRHLKTCPHVEKGRAYVKCNCPVWVDGDLHGRRCHKSLKTRDWQRAQRKVDALESPDSPEPKPIGEAIEAWKAQLEVEPSTKRKYMNVVEKLKAFCEGKGVSDVDRVTLQELDAYRASRKIARITSIKELETLRAFLAFCVKRKWASENYAVEIKTPKWNGNEVVPYTAEEVSAIIAICAQIGRTPYERQRARAMILLLRYTGLRISDVAMLAKSRVKDGQVMLFTQKTKGHVRLPIPSDVETALAALPLPRDYQGNTRDSGYFFWNGITSTRAAVGVAERTLAAVFSKSKVRGAHAHRFRHTLATELLVKGGTMSDVADVLGISEKVARKHYAKWTPARQERISSLMQAIYKPTQAAAAAVVAQAGKPN